MPILSALRPKSAHRELLVAVFALAAGLLAPLARVWLAGQTLVSGDTASLYAPERWLAGDALRHGRLPLWNPYVAGGMPYLAETVHGVLHPVSVLAAFLFPSDGLDPLIAGYVLAAGFGAFVLARSMGASVPSSTVAGFAYGLAGFTLSMAGNLVFLAGGGSLPWLVAGVRAAGRHRTPVSFAAGALGVAVCALSGDVQALVVGCAMGLVLAWAAGGRRGAAVALGSIALGFIVAGIQLVPSWRHLALTARKIRLDTADARQWPLSPWRFIEAISPGFFERLDDGALDRAPVFVALGGWTDPGFPFFPFAASVFVGAPALLLAVAGARTSRVVAVFIPVLLWLALGHQAGARDLLTSIPVVGGFRFAEKYVGPLSLAVAVLAALGVDRVAAEPRRARRWAGGAGVAAAALAVPWLLLALPRSAAALGAAGIGAADVVRAHLVAGLPHAFGALVAIAMALLLAARGAGAGRALVPVAVVVWGSSAAASGFALRAGDSAARLAVAPPHMEAPPPGPRVVHSEFVAPRRPTRSNWNIVDQWTFDSAAIATPAHNVATRLDAIGVETGLTPLRYALLTSMFGDEWGRACRRFGITHAIVPPGADPASVHRALVATDGGRLLRFEPRTGAAIWSVPHREWATLAGKVAIEPEPFAAAARLLEAVRSGDDTVVVESDIPLPAAPGRVLSVSRSVENIRIEAESQEDAVLVVNDAFWPGWRATIDGDEVPIVPADVLVRAISWPPGRHVLEMRYDPQEVSTGAWISGVGLALVAAMCVHRAARRREQARHAESSVSRERDGDARD